MFGAAILPNTKQAASHVQVVFTCGHVSRKIYIAQTPSDWRASLNNLSMARRVLRDLTERAKP